ncbi:MobQ family relaxase [Aquicoccus sp.]|uniref:MobQ family relaxase n=1 Tax=Aquicoccus sp. TaxID=2055851 RepID=UPI0035672825
MASYHLSAKIIGRSDGRSVVAAAAYRAGVRIERAETGDCPDYTRKGGVVSADLLTPDHAPEWAQDRAQLWNAVEAVETRKNSQLAREIELALPNELSDAEARHLALTWARDELVSRGMAADVCIHNPEPVPGGSPNRHAHILCTVRGFDGKGWAKTKDRSWNDKALLQGWRESWADAQNDALEAAGCADRVDHRSLEDQRQVALDAGDMVWADALDRPPEPVLGVAASAQEKRARIMADRRGEEYRPVTARGQALERSRGLRSILVNAWDRFRAAAHDIVMASARIEDPFGRLPASVEDPFSVAPEDPTEETGTGPGF